MSEAVVASHLARTSTSHARSCGRWARSSIDPDLIRVLSHCKKAVEVSIPSRWTTAPSRSSSGTG